MSFDEIKAAVMALPERDQFRLVELIESAHGGTSDLNAEQRAELAEELAALDRDNDPGTPWSSVRAECMEAVDAVQRSRQAARSPSTD